MKYLDQQQQGYSTFELREMALPIVPAHLTKILFVNWYGKQGMPAGSAVSANVDKKNNPLVVISLRHKKYVHEETMPYHQCLKDFSIFQEVAEESL